VSFILDVVKNDVNISTSWLYCYAGMG